MVKRASSWDDEYTEKVTNAEKIIGRPICGAKMSEPMIQDDEPVREFEKRFVNWEKMPFCLQTPVSENGRCEKHGGMSTGAGQRTPKPTKVTFEEENWLPPKKEPQEEIIEDEPITDLIPIPDGVVEITEIKSLDHPYYIGERILNQLTSKGHITPELLDPLIQSCDNCVYRDECTRISHVLKQCYYERRLIYETFGEEFSKNPYAPAEIVRDLAMTKAELFRTQLLMNTIGISQSSKQKITQEKKALRAQILSLRDKLDIRMQKLGDMSQDQSQMLLGLFKKGRVELTERKITITDDEEEEDEVIEVETDE